MAKPRGLKIQKKRKDSFEVAVIGGGPGGYVAAIRSAQLGMKTVLIVRRDIAGVSLRRSRLPTMSLIESARLLELTRQAPAFGLKPVEPAPDWNAVVKRARTITSRISKGGEMTLAKWKIALIKGSASLKDANHINISTVDGEEQTVRADNIVIATGAEPESHPGVKFDKERIISPRDIIDLEQIPRRMLIIGGNAISLEFAYIFWVMGSLVTVIECQDSIISIMDEDITHTIERICKERGIRILTSSKLTGIDRSRDVYQYFIDTGGEPVDVYAEVCVVNVSRVAYVQHLGLDQLGVEMDQGFIKVDDHMRTSTPGIHAVGDCAGPPLLAQAASLEGVCAAETIAGQEISGIRYDNMPSCVYCHPEVATVGISEATAVEEGYNFKIGKYYFAVSGRAVARGEKEGLVKLIVDRDTEKILGAHIVGPGAPELIGQIVIGRKLDMTVGVLANTTQPHPSLSEALTEAAGAVTGKAMFG